LKASLKTELLVSKHDKDMFKEIRELRDRMASMADTLAIHCLRYLIFKVNNEENLKKLLGDAISIANKLSYKLIQAEGTERRKI
jgi:hypothetical protein